jgi:hypothetical protein
MIGENRSVKDIHDTTKIEKAIFPRHVPLFEIGLPELMGADHDPIDGPNPWRSIVRGPQGLPLEEIRLPQDPIDRFFIDDQPLGPP